MRQDQYERLQALSEKLADVFITEADPANWKGANVLPADMTREERGDRLWGRKGAMATGGVLRYTLDLIAYQAKKPPTPGDPDEVAKNSDLDGKIARAEKQAAEAIDRVLKKASTRASNGATG